ncbi:hypothetical protein TRAPUB_13729 [Trametes pubescens]|uniref:Uncharacterized protein n=1 Tax=Trametes pubescens TaxID=154538 RepID=A0A1M2VQD9_TRAPU|nr:hypothetical protein TRAPUB_13729 [Trametes pubescens]
MAGARNMAQGVIRTSLSGMHHVDATRPSLPSEGSVVEYGGARPMRKSEVGSGL